MRPLIIAFMLFVPTSNGVADTDTLPSPAMDSLERTIEMWRHERFILVLKKPGARINEFTTDGCSGGLSAGWEHLASALPEFAKTHGDAPPWESCCVVHDRAYHGGGLVGQTAEQSFEARKQADLALVACVVATGIERKTPLTAVYDITKNDVATLYSTIGSIMYRAVRLGGVPCSGLPWRWGYGWPDCE